jgi:hypothetical protein
MISTPARRYSWRQALALLGAAALLAGTVDGIGYATTGHSVVLGSNASTTASAEKPAASVGKKTVRLKVGAANRVMSDEDLRKITLPKGHYQVSMHGILQPDYEDATTAYAGCLVFDRRLVNNLTNPDYRKVFLLDSMSWSSSGENDWDSVVEQVNVMSLDRSRTIVYGCTTDSDAAITQETPLLVHLTRLDGIDSRNGSGYTLPSPRPAHGHGALRHLLR